MANPTIPTVDVAVENHGSVFLFRLHTEAAREWVAEHVDEPMFWCGALACEPRCAEGLAEGMLSDGLNVE
jgi:hypothetical protein